MSVKCALTLALVLCVCSIESSKILGIFPFAAHSHYALGSRLMKELAEKGHEVTIITPYREKTPPKNYREIFLSGFVEKSEEMKKDFFSHIGINPIFMIFFMDIMAVELVDNTYSHPEVQKLLNNPNEHFDLVILEQFIDDGLKGIAYHYGAPLILLSTIGAGPWVNDVVGNPAPRSFVADPLLNCFAPLNFWQRTNNLILGVLEYINNYFILFPRMDAIMHKYLPNTPSVEELNKNVSLIFLNSHPSTNQPVPLVPNMIEIGGFHVYPPKKLPQDLQKFLDEAKEGVIYFSMGSNLQSKNFPVEKRDAILKVLSKLKEKVLWKWEDDVLPGQPPNVKLGKWLPQQDILPHPNVKAFITHGGLLSTIESICYGVPVVGIPVFADQKMNMAGAVANGFGIEVDYSTLSEETLGSALNEVLHNPKYRENARRRSSIMKDRPVAPLDSAVYWSEYVIKHKGAHHFRSAALDLTWYQYYTIDVILFLTGSSVGVLYVLAKLCKKLCTKQQQKKKQEKKKLN